ncbi:MAG: MTAP family purine nucleoside phosphorylase [Eubacteriales bacterium]
MINEVPKSEFGLIGGSSTFSVEFPEAVGAPKVVVHNAEEVYDTPFGQSPPFKLFSVAGRRVLTCKMHGWRSGVTRADASRQVFWVFQQAGVKRVLAEGGVGAINHLLKPRDLVVPNDYIDFSMRKDVSLGEPCLLVMREALCPEMRRCLCSEAEQVGARRVFDRGVYVVTDGRHFESPAEVGMFRLSGGDIVGQSLCPEVYLAREIGACYARLDMVVNYAEGVVKDWEHEELKEIFYNESVTIGRLLLNTIAGLPVESVCDCSNLRKPTLLKESGR